jgi:stage VI sporulation protein D
MKGGVALSQGNPSFLRFSLEESVWFQKGQEVADLISISLDPNIFIKENEQYVTIQGALELSGEYRRNEIGGEEDEDSFAAPKFIQVVEDRGEGINEFTHFFPVDITIPNNRIENLNDIDVIIESFDYVFPERSCMKLTANLTITGLYGDQQHASQETQVAEDLEPLYRSSAATTAVEEEPVETANASAAEREAEEEFTEIKVEFSPSRSEEEAEQATELPAAQSPEEYVKSSPENENALEGMESPAVNEVQEKMEEEALPGARKTFGRDPQEVVASIEDQLYAPFEAEARKRPENVKPAEVRAEPNEEEASEIEAEVISKAPEVSFQAQKRNEAPPSAGEIYGMVESPSDSSVDVVEGTVVEAEMESESSSSEESPEKQPKKKKASKKKSMSLTEFFARKEEEEDVTKLKMYIVQGGDTIDLVAERYEITVQKLLSVNRLEISQDIAEGQVLYIPVSPARLEK